MKKLFTLFLVAAIACSSVALTSCSDDGESSVASGVTSDATSNESAASTDESAASADESAASADESAASADESAASADESAASEEESIASEEESVAEESSEEESSAEESSEEESSEEESSAEESSEEESSEEESSEEESSAPAEIPEDVKATATYKYLAGIDKTKGITMKTNLLGMDMCACNLGENIYMKISVEMEGYSNKTTMILKGDKAYVLNDIEKTYTVSSKEDMESMGSSFNVVDEEPGQLLKSHVYVSTTTEEYEGATYTVDIFKNTESDQEMKYYLDSKGHLKFMFSGMMTPFEIEEGVIEGCFDIPADYTETTVDEEGGLGVGF